MARPMGLYSRAIAWLKILLPLAALALLSTLFLFSQSREPMQTVPFADTIQDGDGGGEGVSAPYYAGTTPRGDILTMTARRARPDGEGRIKADDLAARLQLSDGSDIYLDAAGATLRDSDSRAHLAGGVLIRSSAGYVLRTEALISGLDRIEAESLGPVSGEGPGSTLEAGKMEIRAEGDNEDVKLLFSGGVKLIYQPPDKESAVP